MRRLCNFHDRLISRFVHQTTRAGQVAALSVSFDRGHFLFFVALDGGIGSKAQRCFVFQLYKHSVFIGFLTFLDQDVIFLLIRVGS